MSSLTLAFLIVLFTALVGVVIAMARSSRAFSGYKDIEAETRALAKLLKGEIFRDGNDLVVSGNYQNLPTIVRFSVDVNTPAVNMRMQAPSTFNLSVVPKGARATEGRVLVRTSDDMFDARCVTRSDHPTQARMFVTGKPTLAALQKLCCSTKTYFTVTRGAMELSELVLPETMLSRHLGDHIAQMGSLAQVLRQMPGAESVKIDPIRRDTSHPVVKVALAVGVITVGLAVYLLERPAEVIVAAQTTLPAGISSLDAPNIAGVESYRVAAADDMDTGTAAWIRDAAGDVSGALALNMTGDSYANDSAYYLIGPKGERRLVVLVAHNGKMDMTYDSLAGVARVPQQYLASIEWSVAPGANADGDGLLIVQRPNDPSSASIVFVSGTKTVSGTPADYRNLRLR